MVPDRNQPRRWGNSVAFARAGSFESASVEPRAAPARPRQTAESARTAGSGVRVVTEGLNTLDLKEAKALLEELAS